MDLLIFLVPYASTRALLISSPLKWRNRGRGVYINVWVLLLESCWKQGAMHRLAADFKRHAWNAREAVTSRHWLTLGWTSLCRPPLDLATVQHWGKFSADARQSIFLHAFIHGRQRNLTTANLYLVDCVDALYLNAIKLNYLSHSIECHDWKAEMLPGALRDNQIGVMYGRPVSENYLYQVRIPAKVSIAS